MRILVEKSLFRLSEVITYRSRGESLAVKRPVNIASIISSKLSDGGSKVVAGSLDYVNRDWINRYI